MEADRNPYDRFFNYIWWFFDRPVTFFREKIVEPNQQHYPWYHQKFRRVPEIDQCDVRDMACYYEAEEQFIRDKLVEEEILTILRNRGKECNHFEGYEKKERCQHLWDAYEKAAANWFCKYGDLGLGSNAKNTYMKQKHRMVWERRHGPVGSGMKTEE